MKFPKSGKAKYLKEKLSEELKMCESQVSMILFTVVATQTGQHELCKGKRPNANLFKVTKQVTCMNYNTQKYICT